MSNLVQAINLPSLYVNGMRLTWTGNTAISVDAGQIRNRENSFDITFDAARTIDGTINGAGGLDTGTLTLNTWYRVFVIYQKTGYSLPDLIISKSDIPTLPSGYDDYIRIGWLRTNASSQFIHFYQGGNGNAKVYEWNSAINVLTGGNATSHTLIDLDGAVPPSDFTHVVFNAAITPNSAGNTIEIARSTTSTAGAFLSGSVAAVKQIGELSVICGYVTEKAGVNYKVSNASDSAYVDVRQFIDYI